MPLSHGLVANLKSVERCHAPVLEVQARSVVAELLGVDGLVAQTRPRSQVAEGGDADEPEVGRRDEDLAERSLQLSGSDSGGEDVVDPEGAQSSPTSEPVESLEVVVEFSA